MYNWWKILTCMSYSKHFQSTLQTANVVWCWYNQMPHDVTFATANWLQVVPQQKKWETVLWLQSLFLLLQNCPADLWICVYSSKWALCHNSHWVSFCQWCSTELLGIEGKRRLFCSSSFLPHFDALFAILFVQHLFCCADIHLFFMLQYFVRNDVNYL